MDSTHLDALVYRLEDERIRRVVEALIIGKDDISMLEGEPFRLCSDLGLIARTDEGWTIANPIYREVIAREITFSSQEMMQKPAWKWQNDDGSLDIDALMREFQKFWRRHSEVWESRSNYTEAFPHLLLMAFLQRVINGGGHIDREYAAGRGRMDLVLLYNKQRYIIEIKLIHDHDSAEVVREEGLEQITGYRDRFDRVASAVLAIFDRRKSSKALSWDEKIKLETENDILIAWQ